MTMLKERLPGAVLIVGCGDIGGRVAARLRDLGCEVTGITRSPPANREQLPGLRWISADLDGEPLRSDAPLVFWFAPPPGEGETDRHLRRWLPALAPGARVVYISTPAVYGDCQGRWIDEDEPLRPQTARGRRRLDAEQALRAAQAAGQLQPVILRVPGIYGPGRLPRERLAKGLPVVRLEEAPWSNRIHADDLAEAALHAAARGRPGQAYHVADGHPSSMSDYFLRCARLLGLPEPPQLALAEARTAFSPALMSYLDESRRLRIDRLRDELGFQPRYPDLEQGLRATLAAEQGTCADGRGPL